MTPLSRTFRSAIWWCVAAVTALAVVLVITDSGVDEQVGDFGTLVASVFAVFACRSAARRSGPDRRGWLFMTVAVTVWCGAQLIWTIAGVFGDHLGAETSLADIGFLGYSIPAVAALLCFRRERITMLTRWRGIVDALVIVSAILFISWDVVIGPAAHAVSASLLSAAAGVAYPLMDAAVASLVLLLVMRQPPGARLPWGLLTAGLVSLAATDTIYISLTLRYDGSPVTVDSLFSIAWVLSMVLIGLAALAPNWSEAPGEVRYLTPAQELVPYLPVAAAVFFAAKSNVFAEPFLITDGILLLLLLGIRTFLLIAEKGALAKDLELRVRARTAQLEHAQEDLRQSFVNSPIGMVWTNLTGEFVQVNAVFADMVGYSVAELVGAPVSSVMFDDDVASNVALISLVSSRDLDYRASGLEKRYRHRDGSVVWTEVSLFVTRDLADAARYLVVQIQDVTERRAAARASAYQASFMEAVLENLDSGVIANAPDGSVILLNRAMRELYGPDQVDDEPETWQERFQVFRPDGVTPLPPEQLPIARAMAGEHVRDAEFVLTSPRGQSRILVANGHSVIADDGTPLGAVIATHDITERRRAEAALNRQALHDPLTDLANRALLRDRLDHAISRRARRPAPLALLLLDLDGFKLINDSLGHQAGDEVLISLADRLRSCLRSEDTIARLGGDEFAVILENTTEAQAAAIAGQILNEIRRPVLIQGRWIASDASIGIMMSTADDSPESLLRNADLAMYAAKDRGKGNVQVFQEAMHETVLARLTLDAELRRAIAEHEFTLVYQPIVSLVSGELQGFEALLRWAHPERGEMSPAAFIPIAEGTGLIVPLGTWVLREACRQAARWRQLIPGADRLTMSVNMSVRQLQDSAVAETVAAALSDSGLPPENLQLEITESAFEHRGQTILDVLHHLHDTGVGLIVDDFGTGYSSLSRLHSLPIDKVKIDKSFVDMLIDGGPAPMVAATIAMAHSLGLRAVAEGVEDAEQLPFLLLNHCDDAQGFLFGRPVGGGIMTELLRERPPASRWGTTSELTRSEH